MSTLPQNPSKRTRALLLVIGILVILALAQSMTGSIIPENPYQALIFQGSFLLVIFGSLILEDKFTKPADAVINAIASIISLVPLSATKDAFWWLLIAYSLIILFVGLSNIVLSEEYESNKNLQRLNEITYEISISLGKSNVLYSLVFLYAVFSFYGTNSKESAILIVVWGIYIALLPLKIPQRIENIFSGKDLPEVLGKVVRVDDPNVIIIKLTKQCSWKGKYLVSLGDGNKHLVLPLFTRVLDSEVVAVGLVAEKTDISLKRTTNGCLYDISDIYESTTEESDDVPVGIIFEGSKISKILFETWIPNDLHEGLLVYSIIDSRRVYYQVTDAATLEESFEKHRHGFQVVEANQVGIFDKGKGFLKYGWLPPMNTLVYKTKANLVTESPSFEKGDFSLGRLPGSTIEVVGNIYDIISHHTAILGVTGSGKTELALKLIDRALKAGFKVFCVDITGDYINVLTNLKPQQLSIDDSLSDQLADKLFEVDAGEYGAGKEKRALKAFEQPLRDNIAKTVNTFLEGDDNLGIFTMPTISNTKATILATEIYLSSIFKYGRETIDKHDRQPILIVLEEAHTVIPEASTMGLGDYDSRGMVSKIAQIALQGRKYRIGLMIISQRTATVSKTVLTQCNTTIAFSSFDQTGLGFLSNIYGSEYASRLSNLSPFNAVVFGKGVKSKRPIIVDMTDKNLQSKSEPTTDAQ